MKFVNALISKDKTTLLNILDDDGVFTIQDLELNTPEVDKATFVNWILNKREEVESLYFYFDICTLCKRGKKVAILNDGYFPKQPKDDDDKSKAGLVFEVKNNKIQIIDFCFWFLKTENKDEITRRLESELYTYMCDNNCTREQAIERLSEY